MSSKTLALKGACQFCGKQGHFKNKFRFFLLKNNNAQVKSKEEASMVEMLRGMDLMVVVSKVNMTYDDTKWWVNSKVTKHVA